MDRLLFLDLCKKITASDFEKEENGIGTLSEKSLHRVLKNYFEPNKNNHEVKIGGYVADIVGEDGIIEIQTKNFSRLIKKLDAFLEACSVTVVYPISKVKWVSWLDLKTGEITKRRKSPKKSSAYDLFYELYRIRYTLDNPRMNVCVCLIESEDIRLLNGWSKDKKRGSTRYERVPIDIFDEIYLHCPQDYMMFIPKNLPEVFKVKDFSKHAEISDDLSRMVLNTLSYLDLVEKIGKDKNAFLYKVKS